MNDRFRPSDDSSAEAPKPRKRITDNLSPADQRRLKLLTKQLREKLDQVTVMDEDSPAALFDKDASRRSLDELFTLTSQYRSAKRFGELLRFITKFRYYSPFNAMLMHIQKPGTTYAAPPHRWLRDYGRHIKPNAQPIVILRPMGPVMFVFDESDTEGEPLPPEIEKPLEVRNGKIGSELDLLIYNATRDGIRVSMARHGAQRGGSIRPTAVKGGRVHFGDKHWVPLRYEMVLSEHLSREARFSTVVHEFGHLYCGHLGTPNRKWWPDRLGLSKEVCEFEAESVAHLVCGRHDIDPASEEYLSGYLKKEGTQYEIPAISFERVMTAAGLIENMAHRKLKPRKEPPE